ncbi:SDR family oxidoreductase [Sphingosinicella sp. BN140058]|uniref:SDR family oxidoreductase n=1 Tax=Sphingosinicella sp. BN140058 TaxID=1892855 RepID=UPI001010EB19|nr:SDR family oxidoreductase [Sphingosinicella sp. BN140058]QAY75539.1 SDR family NAD(P)-dependent oxidoreductase [Sphingosinicella sp. BN140058]
MKRILVLGGYGTFGGRIALRAAAAGFEVLVAGRDAAKARAFCAGRERLVPIVVDRDAGLADALRRLDPFALVDAAGPFQGERHDVAKAAIAAGVHYLDIADGRHFVTGITALDDAAQAAGVVVISGASSLPALSGAAVSRLAEGLDRVDAVEIVLSASSRGTAGVSVAAAILSYLGRPVRLWRGRRWTSGFGWQALRREDFRVAGVRPLRRRLVGIADVPDLDLLPARLPGRPAVDFLAGTDVRLHMLGLWLLSWAVRWRWLESASMLTPVMVRLHGWTRWTSSLRSAFEVRLYGRSGQRRVARSWTLIAEQGEGPEIPSLAAAILLERLEALPPGARDAGGVLRLEDFDASLGSLATSSETRESLLPPPVYAHVMAEAFDTLAPSLRELHGVLRNGGGAGRARVVRGRNPLARLVARLFRFPAEGEHPLHVELTECKGLETWIRDFGGRRFQSNLYARGGLLVERFGLLRFGFALPTDGTGGLAMVMRRWWLGPVRLPLTIAPRAPAREWEEDGRFHFDVSIALPLIGLVVAYRGWLNV